jgi:hypothetical protein
LVEFLERKEHLLVDRRPHSNGFSTLDQLSSRLNRLMP